MVWWLQRYHQRLHTRCGEGERCICQVGRSFSAHQQRLCGQVWLHLQGGMGVTEQQTMNAMQAAPCMPMQMLQASILVVHESWMARSYTATPAHALHARTSARRGCSRCVMNLPAASTMTQARSNANPSCITSASRSSMRRHDLTGYRNSADTCMAGAREQRKGLGFGSRVQQHRQHHLGHTPGARAALGLDCAGSR